MFLPLRIQSAFLTIQASAKKQIVDDLAKDFFAEQAGRPEGILCVFRGVDCAVLRKKNRQGAIRCFRAFAQIKRGRGECIRPAWTPILLFSGGLLMIKLPNLD